ncbi:unnamed protein product [Closterium sp. NIES-54]
MWRDCFKLPNGWTPAQAKRAEEKGKGEEVDVEAVAVVEDYWPIDSGAICSMTPRADLLTELELSPVKHTTSALGQRAEVKGMGKAMFKCADEKMLGLKNIRVVPVPQEREVAASISTKCELVGSGNDANDSAKENESKKSNLRGTSKLCGHKKSGATAKQHQKEEENPKAAAEEYGETMWGTITSAVSTSGAAGNYRSHRGVRQGDSDWSAQWCEVSTVVKETA